MIHFRMIDIGPLFNAKALENIEGIVKRSIKKELNSLQVNRESKAKVISTFQLF